MTTKLKIGHLESFWFSSNKAIRKNSITVFFKPTELLYFKKILTSTILLYWLKGCFFIENRDYILIMKMIGLNPQYAKKSYINLSIALLARDKQGLSVRTTE